MARRLFALCAVMLSCILLTSCATILGKSRTQIEIISEPEGATVRIDGTVMGETPLSLDLYTGRNHIIAISKEGYATQFVELKRYLKGGWTVLDLFTTGGLGCLVDIFSPRFYHLAPAAITVKLKEGTS